jgi:hypothetical protein
LQPERTRLAWRRTALAISVVAVLAARLALRQGVPGVLAALVGLAGWGAAMALLRPWSPTRPATAIPVSALVAAGYAGLGVVIVYASLG